MTNWRRVIGALGALGYTEAEIGRMSISFAAAVLEAHQAERRQEMEFLAALVGARLG